MKGITSPTAIDETIKNKWTPLKSKLQEMFLTLIATLPPKSSWSFTFFVRVQHLFSYSSLLHRDG